MCRFVLLASALVYLTGCATLDRVLYDTSTAVAPPHPEHETPVYGVPDEQEVGGAKKAASPPREGDISPPDEGSSAIACDTEASRTIQVIRLKHAKAEQLAETLGRALPPGMTVVADRPTNSLIISGPSSAAGPPIAPE